MDKVVSLSFGEIALKGANRSYFINKLMSQVRNAVKDLGNPRVYQDLSKIFVEANDGNIDDIVNGQVSVVLPGRQRLQGQDAREHHRETGSTEQFVAVCCNC